MKKLVRLTFKAPEVGAIEILAEPYICFMPKNSPWYFFHLWDFANSLEKFDSHLTFNVTYPSLYGSSIYTDVKEVTLLTERNTNLLLMPDLPPMHWPLLAQARSFMPNCHLMNVCIIGDVELSNNREIRLST